MATQFKFIADRTTARAAVDVANDGDAVRSSPPAGTALPLADDGALRVAIEETPAHLLLAVQAHLTGDFALVDKARPHIKSIWEGGPQIPADLQQDIRTALHATLTHPKPTNAPPLTEARLKELASAIVGEAITDEFVPLLVEQMGFEPEGRFVPKGHAKPPAGFRIAVIGAGMSGIAAGVKFAESGYDYDIYERSSEVGGVWWSNQYPGVAVDTPSHFYSFSFELNPDWPHLYSEGAVLMDYWRAVATKHRIYDHVSFSTVVKSCTWDEATKRWTLVSEGPNGERSEVYDIVISASGLFTHPEPVKVPGLDSFRGTAAHTAHWTPDIDVKGKRVIQIGTGASGFQAGPRIAREAKHLTVFQRTPPWIMIRPDRAEGKGSETAESFRWALRHIPLLAQWMRLFTYWSASDGTHKIVVCDPDWPQTDTSVSAASAGWHKMLTGLLQMKMGDRPDLLAKMTPNYPPMGKRLLRDSDWTDMVKRDNVDLVTTPIDRIVEDGVMATDGTHYPADILVLATGFGMTKMMQHIDVVGRDGVRLRDVWGDEDPRSYMGTMIPGFPNFFLINGPNSGATHGAGVNIYSEAQVHFIQTCLDTIFARGATTIEPTVEAHDRYNAMVDEALVQTVWNHPNVTTYYRNSKGRNFISCPWRIVDFWHLMRQPEPDDMIFA